MVSHLPGTAVPPARGKNARLDRRAPPHCPRLRVPTGQPRSHDHLGHDRPHGPPPGPARSLSNTRSSAQMADDGAVQVADLRWATDVGGEPSSNPNLVLTNMLCCFFEFV